MTPSIRQNANARPSAKEWVEHALRACLPPGIPSSYRSIDGARYISSHPRHEATADLSMFDGRPAKVRVWRYANHPDAIAHHFFELPGGDCSYENGRWVRVDRETLEPIAETIGEMAAHDV